MGNRLYVANVPFAVTSDKLAEHFSQAGTVTDVQLMMDKITGRPRGIAFVTMGSDEDARNAIDRFNGQPFEGRPLTVNEARPREDRAGGPPRRSFDAGGGTNGPPSAGPSFGGGGNGGGGAPRRVFGNDRRPARGGGGGGGRGGRKDKERDFERERGEKRARRGFEDEDDSSRRFARGDFGDDDDE